MLENAAGILLLERAAAAVPGGVGLYDVEGKRLIPLGDGLTTQLGLPAAEAARLGEDGLRRLVHEEDQPRLEVWLRRIGALNDGESAEEAVRLRHVDGRWRSFQLNAVVLTRDAKRRPAAVLGTLSRLDGASWDAAGEDEAAAAGALVRLLDHTPESLTLSGGPPGFPVTVLTRRARELFGRSIERLADLPARAPRRSYGLYLADGRTVPSHDDLPPVRAARFGEIVSGEEWVIRRPDRTIVTVEVHAVPVREGSRLVGAVCSWRDASDRKQLEAALQERAEQLALLIRNTRGGWWSYELATGEVSWSDECAQLFSRPGEGRASRDGFLAAVHPADRPAVTRALDAAALECAPLDLEFRAVLPGGGERWLSASADCHSAEDGSPLRLFGVVTDISARKRADAALRESEERFRQLAETIHEVFWVLDPARLKWLYVSPAQSRVLAREGESPDLQAWLRAVHPADRERVGRNLSGEVHGTEFRHEYRLQTARGIRWMRDRGMVARDARGRATRLLGFTEDITVQRRRESARQGGAGEATVDAAGVVQGAAAGLGPLVARRGQTLAVHAAPVPMPLRGERAALVRTVARLIEVAARCMPENERVEVRVRPRNGVAVVQAGMGRAGASRETVNRLLDLLVCANGACEDGESGRLAAILAMVREEVERLGGSFSAEPAQADGNGGFILRLPLALVSAPAEPGSGASGAPSAGGQRDGSAAAK